MPLASYSSAASTNAKSGKSAVRRRVSAAMTNQIEANYKQGFVFFPQLVFSHVDMYKYISFVDLEVNGTFPLKRITFTSYPSVALVFPLIAAFYF